MCIITDPSNRPNLEKIRKGNERARQKMRAVNLVGGTIPHQVIARHGGALDFGGCRDFDLAGVVDGVADDVGG